MYTMEDVKVLRERTGAGISDCSKALKTCDGDMEKAIDFLREKRKMEVKGKISKVPVLISVISVLFFISINSSPVISEVT